MFSLNLVFLEITFQNLSSSLTIMSLRRLSLIFLSPVKEILEILVILPLSILKARSMFLLSTFFISAFISGKL